MDIAKIRKRLKKKQRFAEAKKKKNKFRRPRRGRKAALSLRPMGSQRTRLPMILQQALNSRRSLLKTEDKKQESEDISQGQGKITAPGARAQVVSESRQIGTESVSKAVKPVVDSTLRRRCSLRHNRTSYISACRGRICLQDL